MNCPVDGTALQMTERQGIEIDYCPRCRGVWLDRGELDKLIERASVAPVGGEPVLAREPRREGYRRDDDWDDDRDDYRRREYDEHGRPRRRRRSFLDDLFDID